MSELQIKRIISAAAAIVLLAGCEQRTWTAKEIRDIAGEAEPYLGGNTQLTMDLQHRIIELERQIEMQERTIEMLGKAADESVKTDNRNVGIYNHFKDTTNDRLKRIETRLGIQSGR
jgi:hypothetical protein